MVSFVHHNHLKSIFIRLRKATVSDLRCSTWPSLSKSIPYHTRVFFVRRPYSSMVSFGHHNHLKTIFIHLRKATISDLRQHMAILKQSIPYHNQVFFVRTFRPHQSMVSFYHHNLKTIFIRLRKATVSDLRQHMAILK